MRRFGIVLAVCFFLAGNFASGQIKDKDLKIYVAGVTERGRALRVRPGCVARNGRLLCFAPRYGRADPLHLHKDGKGMVGDVSEVECHARPAAGGL
jgi:hypothetical protein